MILKCDSPEGRKRPSMGSSSDRQAGKTEEEKRAEN